MAAYGYCRVSTFDQADNLSIPDQEHKVMCVAGYHRLELAEMVSEPGVSGSMAFAARPASGALFAKLEPGDTLIVSKLDRAFRDAEDALSTSRALHERGVRLIVADIGVEPVTENGTGRLFFTILASVAEFERFRIRERTADARKAKKAKGGYIGGSAGFGYRVVGERADSRVVEEYPEQVALRWIREQGAAGVPSRKISKDLETHFGFKLSHVSVCRILKGNGR
jgi:DNA invertase Pin-like site-specific DNA recombinase